MEEEPSGPFCAQCDDEDDEHVWAGSNGVTHGRSMMTTRSQPERI
jgi:hypothetical protein